MADTKKKRAAAGTGTKSAQRPSPKSRSASPSGASQPRRASSRKPAPPPPKPVSYLGELLGVLMIGMGIMCLIGAFSREGDGIFGPVFRAALFGFSGALGYILPFIIMLAGAAMAFKLRRNLTGMRLTAGILLTVCSIVLLHMRYIDQLAPTNDLETFVEESYNLGNLKVLGAGSLGGLLTWLPYRYFGKTITLVLVWTVGLASTFVVLDRSPGELARHLARVARYLMNRFAYYADEAGARRAEREDAAEDAHMRRQMLPSRGRTPADDDDDLLPDEGDLPWADEDPITAALEAVPTAARRKSRKSAPDPVLPDASPEPVQELQVREISHRHVNLDKLIADIDEDDADAPFDLPPREVVVPVVDPLEVDPILRALADPLSGMQETAYVEEEDAVPAAPMAQGTAASVPTPVPASVSSATPTATPILLDGVTPATRLGEEMIDPYGGIEEDALDAGVPESKAYPYPTVDLLQKPEQNRRNMTRAREEMERNRDILLETLQSFGIATTFVGCSRGPAITRYELKPEPGVKVSRIVGLSDDLALNLASYGVRIEAPVPGKAAVGIEVPNKEVSAVALREIVDSPEFRDNPSKITFAIGKDIAGKLIIADLARMPHLLIAGATGSGKSVCINTLIASILFKASPDEVRLIMIDPKVVELSVYNGVPHLLVPVVTDPKKAAGALNWAVREMETRYKLFADRGVREIKGYNTKINPRREKPLPQIVVIIDELADLMMVAPGDVEDAICRLAQLARAAGIHLVIATQRPSVNVITGVIKANIPSRIAFAVASQVDSRTILDMAGAEKLLGRGDMLYAPSGVNKPVRVQGALITDEEVAMLAEHVKDEEGYDEETVRAMAEAVPESKDKGRDKGGEDGAEPDDYDELLPQAVEIVTDTGSASISLLQRRLRVGYARAARLVDEMELRGIVSGFEGSKPRSVLMTREQSRSIFTSGM